MSTIMNPVGPQPASVYWRRRIVVGLGLVAVIAIIMLIVFRPAGDTPPVDAEPSTEPSSSVSSEPTDTVAECDPLDILLEPVTDANSYASGVQPQVAIKVTNVGTVACSINLGTTKQELRITSGSDNIWSSKDCQVDPVDAVRELDPEESMQTPFIPWDRTRSSTSTCDTTRSQVGAGGASYHLRVYLGDLESENTQQFILN